MMKKVITTTIRSAIRRFGIDVVRYRDKKFLPVKYPFDFSERNIEICNAVKPYTMTTPERVNALINAVDYLVANKIDGAMVECGVWKGGSTMAMMLALKKLQNETKDFYLYDTFSGMTAPGDVDVSYQGNKAYEEFSKFQVSEDTSDWCFSSLEEVKQNVFSTGYQQDKIHFIKGKVENTIPENLPDKIALLRLDTDWYESTKHELTHLFPLIQPNGVLIIDDYGYWQGARKAVDEYIADNNICILLNRIDYTGRIGIKI
ncbi:MAG: TylF/MycF/NovP-related O-methyltransferase [Waterburya sp.]